MSMQLQAQVKPGSASTSGFTSVRTGLLQRKCAGDECAERQKKKRLGLQTKLMVNDPGDIYEQEADRIADQVMAAPVHPGVTGAPPRIQRFSGQSNGQMYAAPASVDSVLASPGMPLEPALRQVMGQRFGHDFSRVRVHFDEAAEQSAREVKANAYTVGHDMVFGAGRFVPGTHEGRRLIAHELTHVVQQSGADGKRTGQGNEKRNLSLIPFLEPATQSVARDYCAPAIFRGRKLALQRQADPASPDSSDTIDVVPGEDMTEKNQKVVAFATKASQVLSGSLQAKIVLLSFWSSASTFESGGTEKQDQLRGSARSRGETILRALVKLGVPAGAISVSAIDLNEDGAPKGTDSHTEITLIRSPMAITAPKPIFLPPAPETPTHSQLLDLDKDADLTQSNLQLSETVKYSLLPSLKDPGGTVKVVAYIATAPDTAQKPAFGNDPRLRESGLSRAFMVRATMKSLGANENDVDADVKFVPAGDKRDGHIIINFVPKPAATKPDTGLDFNKFTTIEVNNPNFSLAIKIPKSVELKFKVFEAKLSIPKVAIALKPVRGIPGLEIGFSGEITKISDLIKTPTPTPPGPSGFTQPEPGPPVKFSLSIGVNGKGYKVDAVGGVDLNKRAITAGISFSLLESSVKYQVPSSVFNDLNKAGAQLQKAVNKLMGVPDQPAATTAVGQPPSPPPVASSPELSDLFDVVDAVSNIIDAMGKIDKAKEEAATRPTLKVGPTVTIPFGPPREGTFDDPLGNKPIFGAGVTGTFD